MFRSTVRMSLPRRLLNWLGRPRSDRKSLATAPVVERPDWWSRVSIHQTTLLKCPFEEELALLEQSGVPGIGLSHLKLQELSPADIVGELAGSPLQVSSLGVIGGFTGYNEYSFDDAIREGTQLIEMARAVRAPVVRVVSGPYAGHLRKHARRLLLMGLEELLPVAQTAGVKLVLQPMSPVYREWTFLSSLDMAMGVLDEFRSSHVGLALGTYHLGREKNLLQRIESIGSLIGSVQVSDWVPTNSDADRRLPGEGRLPLAEILAAIESTGYQGWYELEVWSRDLWKQDPETLMSRCLQSLGSLVPVNAR